MARGNLRRTLMTGVALLALTACVGFDPDLRGDLHPGGFDTSDAAVQATSARPAADNRGIIAYPGYQVAVARRGDTVASVASRIGMGADELARYNGLTTGDVLRAGEVLALPRRVSEPSVATGAPATGGFAPERVDVATIAGGAIDRAAGSGTATPAPTPAPAAGPEPVRHQVKRGETAYSIARLYNVSVRSLQEWNGLGPDLSVREGQFLMIPVASGRGGSGAQTVAAPGTGSATPPPPSSSEPLPDEKTVPAAAGKTDPVPSPDLGKGKTSSARLQMPVSGKIIREFAKKKNEGIDIAAAGGSTVVAAESGTVAAITQDTEQVPIVVIRHDGNLLTVYAGIDGIAVKKGDKVKRGQKIGVVRAANPAFLHFEVRQGFESTDPVPFLN